MIRSFVAILLSVGRLWRHGHPKLGLGSVLVVSSQLLYLPRESLFTMASWMEREGALVIRACAVKVGCAVRDICEACKMSQPAKGCLLFFAESFAFVVRHNANY